MPNYVVVEAPRTAFPQELEERRPLREQVFICLQQWDVDSSSSEDSDDFCGWRVGSRALPPASNNAVGASQSAVGFTQPHSLSARSRRKGSGGSGISGGTPASDALLAARVAAIRTTTRHKSATERSSGVVAGVHVKRSL